MAFEGRLALIGPEDYLESLRERLADEHVEFACTSGGIEVDQRVLEQVKANHDQLVARFWRDDRLVAYPAKRSFRYHILLHLVGRFSPGVVYAEAKVNEVLKRCWHDFAYLRRELVDYGYLRRNNLGEYWLVNGEECFTILHRDAPLWEHLWLPAYLNGRKGFPEAQ
ncbi:DUF2087 domain-containing protein [Kocuria massiliensis]|uniref:DUF2087 domain-containing protein n=1 Tax=Kocuria massiliensis TaxID=1926282 RepID=UPI0022B94432|nr:DUF2087 domain-containing protein [Kocuria massiliensis]